MSAASCPRCDEPLELTDWTGDPDPLTPCEACSGDQLGGITVEELRGRYRVLANFGGGVTATLGTFDTAPEAVAYATVAVLDRQPQPDTEPSS